MYPSIPQNEASILDIKTTQTTQFGVLTKSQETPDNWVDVVKYHPHSTPWDYHGNKEIRRWMYVFQASDIPCIGLVTRMTRINPQGSGPYGRVRLGDADMPGNYRVAVPNDYLEAAQNAIKLHEEEVHNWLHKNGPMPDACR